MMGCSPGLEKGRRRSGLPDHGGAGAAPLSFNARWRRLGFVALRWAGVRGVCGGQIRATGGNWRACPGWRRNHGGDPEEADREQRPRAILARVAELLERRGRLGRGPACGLGCGVEELPQSAAERGHGQ
jgi:hypothetical protein